MPLLSVCLTYATPWKTYEMRLRRFHWLFSSPGCFSLSFCSASVPIYTLDLSVSGVSVLTSGSLRVLHMQYFPWPPHCLLCVLVSGVLFGVSMPIMPLSEAKSMRSIVSPMEFERVPCLTLPGNA